MIKRFLFLVLTFTFFSNLAFAEMQLFVGETCPHCQNLESYLESNNLLQKYDIKFYEIYNNEENRNIYLEKAVELDYRNGGVPWLVDGENNVEGDTPIRKYLADLDGTAYELASNLDSSEPTTLSAEDSDLLNDIIKEEAKVQAKENKQTSDNSSTIYYAILIIGPLGLALLVYLFLKKRSTQT